MIKKKLTLFTLLFFTLYVNLSASEIDKYYLLNKKIQEIINIAKKDFNATNIIVSVMESNTGNILSLQTTDVDNSSAFTYLYEPGFVISPFVFASALDEDLIQLQDFINLHNGEYLIENHTIKDEYSFQWAKIEDVIIHSSNIGMAKIAQKLSSEIYHQRLVDFGFTKKIEFYEGYQLHGNLISKEQLKSSSSKAYLSYGYGIKVTFMQLMRAYNIFNNNGYLQEPNIESKPFRQLLTSKTVLQMKNILTKTVEKGTGQNAKTEGISVGGKTGVSHFKSHGIYINKYNTSFFGFANDEKNKYTIGVTLVDPKTNYYASQTAVPLFKEIVKVLFKDN